MASIKNEFPRHDTPAPPSVGEAARLLAAALLMVASASLARFAAVVAPARALLREDSIDPRVEFYADASGGALYLDGELVGYLPGVSRL